MRKLKSCKVHQTFNVVGCGEIKPTLGGPDYRDMDLWFTDIGTVEVKYRGVHFVVAAANIVVAVFDDPQPQRVAMTSVKKTA